MGLIEQYNQEIQKQKGPAEKLSTSRRWRRDAKQGKLDNECAKEGMDWVDPVGMTYTTEAINSAIRGGLIYHIQAELEYLEGLRGTSEPPNPTLSRATRMPPAWDPPTQDVWKGKDDFKNLLRQLSMVIHFVDEGSYRRSENIFQTHFANCIDLCGGKETKINWKGTWNAYRYFFNTSQKHASPLFDTYKTISPFFMAHFLKNGEEILEPTKIINSRGYPMQNQQKRLDAIIDSLRK